MPERARAGIGSALLASAEQAMRDAGFKDALLWVLARNADARAFYERAGWQPDGTEKQEEIGGQPVTEVRYRKALRPGG
jgi:GNAT superfamily N-acetyltransferase